MGICQSDEYTEAQVREYCVTHNKGQLYQTVQLNLSIEAERAKDIAAYVAFSLAGGEGSGTITEGQFDDFKKKVCSPLNFKCAEHTSATAALPLCPSTCVAAAETCWLCSGWTILKATSSS